MEIFSSNGVQCFRCRRRSPKAQVKFIRNVPLGLTCFEVVISRMALRGKGENSRMVESEEGGTFLISDLSRKFCPDPESHCLQCMYLMDQSCPLEIAVS